MHNTSFWAGKRIVIAGGCGLVGASLVKQLLDAGAQITVLDDYSRGKTQIESDRARYIQGDAGDAATCAKWFVDADAVFNLAAYVAGVTYNQNHSLEMFERNIRLQTVPLIAAKVGVKRFLQVSSVCVYAENKQNPCLESDIGGDPHPANAGYAWAKRMGERAALWSGLERVVIVRPANIYGIGDYFDERAHVIPALIKKITHDEVIRVNGTGQEVREFLYADDAARGMMVALERGKTNRVYNIGSDGANSCTIGELAYTLRDLLGVDKSIEFSGGEAGDDRRIVNGDKLMRLGWSPEVNLADGLKRVCEWYQKGAK
ncbi:MAG: hypothetical protein A2W25_15050 [candidate division Zixibacteria bacterium RBG_16_53_22]|nr:MAG: hypothetical protein A2W25_15050 [candidate division Zixibacteria bacterium RBG_16_53_22]